MKQEINLRYIAGEIIGYALIYTGVARMFLNRRFARGEATAFFLHDPDKLVFEKVLDRARRWGFAFVDDSQLADFLNGQFKSDKPLLHISLDDGWSDNPDSVAQYAERHNIPVTYFISTEPMESGDFWWRRIDDPAMLEQLMSADNAKRVEYMAHLARPARGRDAMTAEQVVALSRMQHATIGNHTHNHPNLGNCAPAEIDFEIREADRRLRELTGNAPVSFAYPSGSINGHEREVLRDLGYAVAFSVEPEGIVAGQTDCFRIPRFSDNMHAGPAENFCRLIGLWQGIYRLFARTPKVYASTSGDRRPIALLQFIPEPTETFRPDVTALFRTYLPRRQVDCKLVGSNSQHEAVVATSGSLSALGKISRKLRMLSSYWGNWFRCMSRTSRYNCDVIQVRDMALVGVLTLLWARWKGIPFCYWSSFLMCDQRVIKARAELRARLSLKYAFMLVRGLFEEFLMYRIVFHYADHVFVQSDAMAAYYHARGVPLDQMTAVPMGVDMEQLDLTELKADRPPHWVGAPVIAYLGTLNSERGVRNLIDVLQKVRQSVPTARLALIGSSERAAENEALLRHASSLGLADAVEITGWLPSKEAWKLMLNADVAVSFFPRSPVFDTCTPTKCLEYLAAQIPCVANDNPDQAQILTQSDAGWLVRNDDADLVAALVDVLNDLPAARRRAATGSAYIESHRSYRVISEMVAHCYRDIVHEARLGQPVSA